MEYNFTLIPLMSYVHETNLPYHVYNILANFQIKYNALLRDYFIPLIFPNNANQNTIARQLFASQLIKRQSCQLKETSQLIC